MARAVTRAASWVNMDAMRINKPATFIRTNEAERRRHAIKNLTHAGENPLVAGTKRFGPIDCIYIIRMDNTDAYKIGYTHHLRQRLSALGAGIPVPVRPVSWVSFFDDEWLGEAEFRAHELASLYGQRLKGEWFNLRPDDIRKIVDHLIDGLRDEVMGVSYTGEVPR